MITHRLAHTSLLVTALAALVVASASGQAAAKPKLVTTKGAIEALAMDGQVIAYDLEARDLGCNTVHAWIIATGKDSVLSGAGTCQADSTSTGAGVRELAVAGNRVAWIVNLGGNTESADTLYVATVGGKKEQKIASALRTGDVDADLTGDWLGNLAGDRGLIALNAWKTLGPALEQQRIAAVGTGLTTVHQGIGAMAVRSVDTGRIAVLNSVRNDVYVYTSSGALMTTFKPAGKALEVALRKDFLVVLVAGGTLQVHDAANGALIDTIPVPGGARNLDVHANIAVFTVGKAVRAVRLATGKQATIATTPRAIVDVQIDDAGLAYAFNTVTGVKGVGKLAFVPLSLVQAKLS
jgi:hypothetical protein